MSTGQSAYSLLYIRLLHYNVHNSVHFLHFCAHMYTIINDMKTLLNKHFQSYMISKIYGRIWVSLYTKRECTASSLWEDLMIITTGYPVVIAWQKIHGFIM